MRAVDCLLLRVTCSAGLRPAFSSPVRCAALAAEKLENLRGISRDNCLLNCRGALHPRRHLASLVQGGGPPRRSDREPASMAFTSAVKLRDPGSPLDKHRSGDQQYKKDRHQDRGYQPLTKIESGIWHMTASGFWRERKALSHR